MDCVPLLDLDALEVEALKALVMAHRKEISARQAALAAKETAIARQRQARNCSCTDFQGGKLLGICRHWQTVFTTYSSASTTRRRSYLRGRPPA